MREREASWRPDSRCRRWRTPPGRSAATWSKSCSSICTGSRFTDTSIHVSALSPDGRALVVWDDASRTAEGLRAWSAKDAARWPAFQHSLQRLGALIGGAVHRRRRRRWTAPTTRDVFALMQTLRAFRSLPKADQWRLLRWGPMAVADLVSEVDRDRVAARGGGRRWHVWRDAWSVVGRQRPAAAADDGESIAGRRRPAASSAAGRSRWRGRSKAPRLVIGVEIRTGDGVTRIEVKDDRAIGVTLDGGESPRSARGDLGGRSEAHLPDAVRRRAPAAGIPVADQALSIARHAREGQPRAVGVAAVSPAPRGEMLAGRVRLAPDLDYLERAFDHAKYGRFSPHPWIEFTIPSLDDPTLAPPGAHVLSAYAQFAPYTLARGRLGLVARCVRRSRGRARSRNTRRASGR